MDIRSRQNTVQTEIVRVRLRHKDGSPVQPAVVDTSEAPTVTINDQSCRELTGTPRPSCLTSIHTPPQGLGESTLLLCRLKAHFGGDVLGKI